MNRISTVLKFWFGVAAGAALFAFAACAAAAETEAPKQELAVPAPPGFEAVKGAQPPPAPELPVEPQPSMLLTNKSTLTNGLVADPESAKGDPATAETSLLVELRSQLEMARHLRHTRQPKEAEPILVELLGEKSPDSIKQQALLELAAGAKDQNDLARAQQVYAQFLNRWPNDLLVPEVLLRQGQLFRQMGLNNLALAKFYAVMTSSLVLKNDMMDYYQRLVLLAQTEIAESHYQLGKYAEAAEFFGRLLKQNSPGLDRPLAQFRLIRSLAALPRNDETVAQAQDYLGRYPTAPEQPEVRFHLAQALKHLGRNNEALQQVLTLLQEQRARTKDHPELWAYWQQRAGNEIGNQLYREGDYTRALGIYLTLAQLDPQPSWQLPVQYQIGLTYERLSQPQKALETYQDICKREPDLGTNAAPGLTEIIEMARWRSGFLQWQDKADAIARPSKADPKSTKGSEAPDKAAKPPLASAPAAKPE
jgi:tetratricopeptide (TPR) repeat protein